MHERPIVVGVDGTTTALRAVSWAAEEAHLRRRPLHVVHAAPYLGPAGDEPATRRRADAILARARAVALHAEPDLDVVTRLLPEPPISALVDVSADAELLVLGMLGDADAGIVLGPVALDVMTGAQCPVTVVHGHGSDGYGRPAPGELGSVSRFVLRYSRVPVTVVPRRLFVDHVARTSSVQAQDPHDRSQLW